MKKFMLLASGCLLSLGLSTQINAAPSCPSASEIKNIAISSVSPAEKKGWEVASGSNNTLSVFAFVHNAGLGRGRAIASRMLHDATTSWAPPQDIGMSDPDTGKEYYVCLYKPYANVDVISMVDGGEPDAQTLAVLFEADQHPLVTKRKLF